MDIRIARRSLFLAAAGAAVAATGLPGPLLAGSAPGIAPDRVDWARAPVRLLMVVARGCPNCAAWRREIGPAYPGSAAGGRAPLLVVDIDGPWPDGIVMGSRPRLTPTFMLLRNGAELGRIEGYDGAARFQSGLGDLLLATGPGTRRRETGA